jgi:hypothetical protein
MSAIEPIDNRVRPVEPVRRPVRRDEREAEAEQHRQKPREREPKQDEQPSEGGLVDVRV